MTTHRRARLGWRALGAALLAGAYLPLHRLLAVERAGPAAAASRAEAEAILQQSWTGSLAVLALSAFVVLLVGLRTRMGGGDEVERARRLEAATARGLTAVSERVWITGCGVLAGALAAFTHHLLLAGRATLTDELVQLRHARLLAEGAIADAWAFDPAFRNSVNGLWTAEGWSSIYPPGHTAVLAAFGRLGLEGWTGPVLTALTAGFTAALLLRLFPSRPTTARVAALAAAASPFLWGLGAGWLSHTSAACAVAIALWSAVRARDESPRWAIATGAAAGWATLARPWTGLTTAVALPVGLWVARAVTERSRPPALRLHRDDEPDEPAAPFTLRSALERAGWATLGGLPFALLLGLWNHRLFGSPLRFGYDAAFGPAHGLGLHRDPWGNLYGAREALGYTGADLVLLGRHLFETPVPAVAAIGAWLLIRGRPFRGSGLLLAWSGAAVLANALYWHHGQHFGPRMLYESAPAWAALTVLAAVGLGLPRGTLAPPSEEDDDEGVPTRSPWALVAMARVMTVVALAWGLALSLPLRVGSWSLPPEPPLPDVGAAPALVFVHGSWAGREAARLEAAGMRRDSIETALRRNDLCRVHEYARARREGEPLPPLDLEARPGSPETLTWVLLSEGNRARVDPAVPWSASCHREAAADREGTVELATVLARRGAAGPDGPVVWVRDLGPEQNAALIERHPDRAILLWTATSEGGPRPYAAAASDLWTPPN